MKLFRFKQKNFSIDYLKALKELEKINNLEPKMQALNNKELQAKTAHFKKLLEEGVSPSSIRPEAFAVAREATRRILKKRLFDVQVVGGIILDSGSIAEMKTGEGKTITSILPAYLNALSGGGVIVSTVNEYLTQRDADETGQVHNFLGLTVGVNKRELNPLAKRQAYACDITYSVHSEVGFDYLRDNMVKKIEDKVQRPFNFVLIDEVDSILIDEARTPLIITGGKKTPSQTYLKVNHFAKTLAKNDYEIDLESKSIVLTNTGIDKANKYFQVTNFYGFQNSELVHQTSNALRANYLMKRDTEYIIQNQQIKLIDSFTGRIMEGRSYSDGLQQAIQAKEGVKIEQETQTLATITYQNLFRMFKKIAGMTGTAKTEEEEFLEIYNTKVQVIPTNKPMIRVDHHDVMFVKKKFKYKAIIDDIIQRQRKGQPVLVGTEEVSESEALSQMLQKAGVVHTVLNAKQNEHEAQIIAKAGEFKAVTIATNMAGRGTDIVLSPKSVQAGGLYVIGTNRSEARRIDNQLKGRSGRQGDVGESRFYLSLEDTLISRFSNQEKLVKLFSSVGAKPIMRSKQVAKILKRAQVKIEGFNYDSRKNVLQFDDVIRQQRDLTYAQRDIIIGHGDLLPVIHRMMTYVAKDVVNNIQVFQNADKSLNIDKLVKVSNNLWLKNVGFNLSAGELVGKENTQVTTFLGEKLKQAYEEIRKLVVENKDEDFLHMVERQYLLSTFDNNWKMQMDQMTKLRTSSSLSSYAQKNPFQVYLEEGSALFNEMLKKISHNAVKLLMQNPYGKKVDPSEKEKEASLENNVRKTDQFKKAIVNFLKKQRDKNNPDQEKGLSPQGDLRKDDQFKKAVEHFLKSRSAQKTTNPKASQNLVKRFTPDKT